MIAENDLVYTLNEGECGVEKGQVPVLNRQSEQLKTLIHRSAAFARL
jgi:hypothetical protein